MKSLSSASVLGAQNSALLVILIMAIVMANSSLGLRPHQFSFQDQEGDLGNNGDHTSPTNPKQGYIIRSGNKSNNNKNKALGMEMYPTGSSLPDCSHACGPCFPCKRVMVSFKCSVESCPIVYRCMCKGKYYHVPSN